MVARALSTRSRCSSCRRRRRRERRRRNWSRSSPWCWSCSSTGSWSRRSCLSRARRRSSRCCSIRIPPPPGPEPPCRPTQRPNRPCVHSKLLRQRVVAGDTGEKVPNVHLASVEIAWARRLNPSLPLSVLDLAGRRQRLARRRPAHRSTSPRQRSGSATTASGSPSTTTCPASPAPSPAVLLAHLAAPHRRIRRRLRRRDAAQPRAAGGRRAVRHAGGARPGPDRPRPRPRARHRPGSPRRALRRRVDRLDGATTSPSSSPS